MNSVDFRWGGESLRIYADKAILWIEKQTLIITDPHFGKASAFRHAGIPIPAGTTDDDLHRLTNLIHHAKPHRLLILGDFFHHRTGCCEATMTAFTRWRESVFTGQIHLVEGNHDKYSAPIPPEWNFTVTKIHQENALRFCHYPEECPGEFVIAGHIHPGVRLSDPMGGAKYLPCFHFGKRTAVLPAFGGFTGISKVSVRRGDHVFAIYKDSLYPINTSR